MEKISWPRFAAFLPGYMDARKFTVIGSPFLVEFQLVLPLAFFPREKDEVGSFQCWIRED